MSETTPPSPDQAVALERSAARPSFSVRLRARDLLNVAIFAVIYLVVMFAVSMFGLINPLVMVLTLLLSALAACIPYMLFLTRVKRPGMVALFGVVFGLFCGLSGLGWIAAFLTVVLSLVGEVVMWSGHYRSRLAAVCTCAVFTLWFAAPFVPLLLDREAYLTSSEVAMNGPDYVARLDDLLSVPVVVGYMVATLVCGLLGGLLGSRLLRKHFVRAGLA